MSIAGEPAQLLQVVQAFQGHIMPLGNRPDCFTGMFKLIKQGRGYADGLRPER